NDMFSRLAMNVSRLFPTVGTGDVPVASRAWLLARNGVWMLTMFWQNIAGLLVLSLNDETSGWPTSARYRSVFCRLKVLLTSDISSFSGTRATGARWFLAEDSSFRACEVPGVPCWDRSGASNGVQPSVGSRNASSSSLSLPLLTGVAPASPASLAALNCAV